MFLRYLIITITIIILGQTSLYPPVQNAASNLLAPLQYTAYQISSQVKSELQFLREVRNLKNENRKLSLKVWELESQLAELKETQEENQTLREQLQVLGNLPTTKLSFVQIIGRAPQGAKGEIIINQGASDGIKTGHAVIYKNFLLGEVARVQNKSAVVRLTTDSSFRTTALDQDSPTRSRGLVRGEFGTNLILEKVLPNEQISLNDTIITSGEDGKFVKGLIVGKIIEVLGKETEVFKTAQLELPVEIDRLEGVFVLKP